MPQNAGLKTIPDHELREAVAVLLSEVRALRADLAASGTIKSRLTYVPRPVTITPAITPPLPAIDVSPGRRKRSVVT